MILCNFIFTCIYVITEDKPNYFIIAISDNYSVIQVLCILVFASHICLRAFIFVLFTVKYVVDFNQSFLK